MKGFFDGLASHDLDGLAERDLLLVEDEGVGEDLRHAFELVMGSDDEVAAVGQVDKGIGEMTTAFDIESVEGFIEKKDMSFLGEGPGDEGALLLAAGELIDLAMGDVAEVHGRDGFFGFFAIYFVEAFKMAEMGEASHCHDIADPNREMALMAIDLGEVGDFASCFRDGIFPPLDGSGLLREKPGEKSDEGAFARSVWTEEGKALTAVSREDNIAQSHLGAVVIADSGEIELVVFVLHGSGSQVNSTSSVTSISPQRV